MGVPVVHRNGEHQAKKDVSGKPVRLTIPVAFPPNSCYTEIEKILRRREMSCILKEKP